MINSLLIIPLVSDGNKFVNFYNESRNIDYDFFIVSHGNVKEVPEVFTPRGLKTVVVNVRC